MNGAEGLLKLPVYTGSEETIFYPDSSGSSNMGPYHPSSPVFYSMSPLSSSLGAPSPIEFLKLRTLHEEIEKERESVVDSNTGPVAEVDAEASSNSQLPQTSQEQDEVDVFICSMLPV
ncbi:hypothetical protein XENOCAPTIV_019200 [Xenoophorus captivus]|uniref:Uncharacterized protein n=1 Tax=Xenoophorus captivus TaxID=1517983 RepID=A0ABV0SB20_9TELE